MKDITGVEEILYFVSDLSGARIWFSDLLGAEPVFEEAGYIAFRLGNTNLGIHPEDQKTSHGVSGQVAYWGVEDLEKAKNYFIEHGCTLFRGPIIGADGVKICQLTDPFGNAWGLVEKQPADIITK